MNRVALFRSMLRLALAGIILTTADAYSQQGSNCPTSLAYLASQLSSYPSDPEITAIRNQMLASDWRDSLKKAREQGYTPAQAARLALRQAEAAVQMEDAAKEALRARLAHPEDTDRIVDSLRTGSFRGSGPLAPAMGAYVVAYYNVIVAKEAAIALPCLARAER